MKLLLIKALFVIVVCSFANANANSQCVDVYSAKTESQFASTNVNELAAKVLSVVKPQVAAGLVHSAVIAEFIFKNTNKIQTEATHYLESEHLPIVSEKSTAQSVLSSLISKIAKNQEDIEAKGNSLNRKVFRMPKFLIGRTVAAKIAEMKEFELQSQEPIEKLLAEIRDISPAQNKVNFHISRVRSEMEYLGILIEELGTFSPDLTATLMNRNFSLKTTLTLLEARGSSIDQKIKFSHQLVEEARMQSQVGLESILALNPALRTVYAESLRRLQENAAIMEKRVEERLRKTNERNQVELEEIALRKSLGLPLEADNIELMNDVLTLVKSTHYVEHRDDIIRSFAVKHRDRLTVNDILTLMKKIHYVNNRDEVGYNFVVYNIDRITLPYLIEIARAAHFVQNRDKILLHVANNRASQLTAQELSMIAKNVHYVENKSIITKLGVR